MQVFLQAMVQVHWTKGISLPRNDLSGIGQIAIWNTSGAGVSAAESVSAPMNVRMMSVVIYSAHREYQKNSSM
jgi:hypothetical protein